MATYSVESTYTVQLTADELRAIHWAITMAQGKPIPGSISESRISPRLKDVLNHLVATLPTGAER